MQLPPLMKDLNEGMKLIGWPEAAQKEFFGKLLPAHAESLKGQPLTRARPQPAGQAARSRLRDAGAAAPRTSRRAEPVPEVLPEVIERRFTPEEAQAGRPGRRERRSTGRTTSTSTLADGRRPRPRRRHPAAGAGVALGARQARSGGGRPARADDLGSGRAGRADARAAADRPHQARLRLPDAPEGRVAEGPARPRQLGPELLRLHARRQAPGDDLDDLAHARPDVRDRAIPRGRERLPDGARDGARAEAAGRARARATRH